MTTAATGEGVPELLAALDRHRAAARGSDGAATRAARAEAQVWAVLADRLHERARSIEAAPIAAALLDAVASHELDPYAAADQLLELMAGGGALVARRSRIGAPGRTSLDRRSGSEARSPCRGRPASRARPG